MNAIITLPAGIRLDAWPEMLMAKTPTDSPEVAVLRQELRNSMPVAWMAAMDMLEKMRPMRDLAGRLAGPQPAKIEIHNA